MVAEVPAKEKPQPLKVENARDAMPEMMFKQK